MANFTTGILTIRMRSIVTAIDPDPNRSAATSQDPVSIAGETHAFLTFDSALTRDAVNGGIELPGEFQLGLETCSRGQSNQQIHTESVDLAPLQV